MRKIIMMALFAVMTVMSVSAAKRSETPKKLVYCDLMGWSMHYELTNEGDKFSEFKIDFGDEIFKKYPEYKKDDLKTLNFHSLMDALNYMAERGWVLDQAKTWSVGYDNVYHFIMKKYVTEDYEILNGIVVLGD